MIKALCGDINLLTKWLGAVDADVPALRSFTAGVRRDMNAGAAGLTRPYTSGPVEGTVTRIKQLKAAKYGRTQPDLLRKQILLSRQLQIHPAFDTARTLDTTKSGTEPLNENILQLSSELSRPRRR